jgi:hypothetical protein
MEKSTGEEHISLIPAATPCPRILRPMRPLTAVTSRAARRRARCLRSRAAALRLIPRPPPQSSLDIAYGGSSPSSLQEQRRPATCLLVPRPRGATARPPAASRHRERQQQHSARGVGSGGASGVADLRSGRTERRRIRRGCPALLR